MSSLRIWSDSLSRKPGCRVPRYSKGYTPDLLQRLLAHTGCRDSAELARFFDTDAIAHIGIKRPADRPPIDYSRYFEGRDIPPDTRFGELGTARAPAGYYHFSGLLFPLDRAGSLKEIEDYPIEDISDWPTDGLKEQADALHAKGAYVSGSVGSVYETAWQMRGYEQFLTDLMLQPAWAESLLERLTQRNIVKARATARAGADMLHLGDDVANQNALMFPPDLWRRVFKTRMARVIAAGRKENPHIHVWYHSDGNATAIIPDLIEVGVTILNPVQPECMDPVAIHREYGKDLAMDGTIGTQSVMPFGTADEVEETVARVIERCGQNGGLVLSPTHVLEPEVPIENIEALFRACSKYGNGA